MVPREVQEAAAINKIVTIAELADPKALHDGLAQASNIRGSGPQPSTATTRSSAASNTTDSAWPTRLPAITSGQPTMSRRSPKRTPNPSRYVSIKFAAERTGVSTDTIRRMIADATLPAYRFRDQIRIALEDIDAAMRPIN